MEFDYEEYLDDYFDPMELTEEEKEDRKDMAKEIREAILFWFFLLMLAFQYAIVDYDNLKNSLRNRLAQVIYNHSTPDAYTVQYIDILTNSIFDTTMKDVEKQTQDAYIESGYDLEQTYALSDERATFIGANEADSIGNREDWLKAIEEGKTHKTWKAFIDKRTRFDHEKMDGKKIPIKEYFKFPDCKMLYPHDEVNGSAKQTVNCRCTLKYTKEGEAEINTSGAVYGAYNDKNDPTGNIRYLKGKELYQEILNRKKDFEIEAVAEHSGMTKDEVNRVYEHMFVRKHLLSDGVRRFDPDYDQAVSWLRLRDGKNIQPHDLVLLKHELAEEKIMGDSIEIPYEKAHNEVVKKYDYQKALDEYYKRTME